MWKAESAHKDDIASPLKPNVCKELMSSYDANFEV